MGTMDSINAKKLLKDYLSGKIDKTTFINTVSASPMCEAKAFFEAAMSAIDKVVAMSTRIEKEEEEKNKNIENKFTSTMEKFGYKDAANLDTPERSMLNSLIVQLLEEGMSISEIQREFTTLGTSPMDKQITQQICAMITHKMQYKLREIETAKAYASSALTAEKQEQAATEAPDNSLSPSMSVSPSVSKTLGNSPKP